MNFLESPYYRILQTDIARLKFGPDRLDAHFAEAHAFIAAIPEAKGGHAYAEGKWTVSEVIGHIADAQVVFLNRMLFIARGETCALPAFEEGMWVRNARHRDLTMGIIAEQYRRISAATEAVVANLPAGAFQKQGLANGVTITVEEILIYLMAHENHHLGVLAARYLESE